MSVVHFGSAPARAILVPVLLSVACSASSDPGGASGGASAGASGSSSGSGGTIGIGTGGTVGSGGTLNLGGSEAGGTGGGETCAVASADAEIVAEPVDVMFVLDNSGSMQEEMQAAESNINVNFATILDNAGIDYRVILLSRHRHGERGPFDDDEFEEANTSICVAQPLSGLAACPAPLPVFSEKFYQYSEKIESWDALNWLLDGYAQEPEDDDYAELTPDGYGPFLRDGAKKAIVVMTDDDESADEDDTPLTVDAFLAQVTALAPQHFGADAANPTFTFHSIVGIVERANPTEAYPPGDPVVTEVCSSNMAVIENPGQTYQELSIRTGGLRFPLCQFPGYDAVFEAIAKDVVLKSNIACDFAIPPPPQGQELDLTKVAVKQTKGDGSGEVQFGQASTADDCRADAFYIEGDRIYLCAETCDAVRADPGASIDVLFTCESTILPPK